MRELVSATPLPPTTQDFLALIRQRQRGRLRIYIGYAPGVGKARAMLDEGQRLKNLGVDVVIAILDRQTRPEVAERSATLEQVPRLRTELRGVSWEQMDLDAVLSRRPTVALVGELARANAPASRFPYRSQDVEDLLRAGINVIATLDRFPDFPAALEHAGEGKTRNRAPEYFFNLADQIVCIDLAPELLRERFLAGKLGPLDGGDQALADFYSLDNLKRRRDLFLECTIPLLKAKYKQDEARAGERFMICINPQDPLAAAILRKGAALARGLKASWYAVTIQSPGQADKPADARFQELLAQTQQLDGIAVVLNSTDVAPTIAAFAREYSITHAVLGRPRRHFGWRWFGQSTFSRLLSSLRGLDVILVSE